MNKIKETQMNQAITFMTKMTEQAFQEKIEAAQENARQQREKKRQEEKRKARMAQNKPVGECSLCHPWVWQRKYVNPYVSTQTSKED